MENAKHNGHGNGKTSMNEFMADSAEQAWLAGIGALARARREGLKVCSGIVGRGKAVRPRPSIAKLPGLSALADAVANARRTAGEAFDRIEEMVEARITRSLNRLQIPTARDTQELTRRVEELTRAVSALDKDAPAQKRSARRGTTAKRKVRGK